MARVGQKIKLECEITGTPRPQIHWTHNGKAFTGRDFKVSNTIFWDLHLNSVLTKPFLFIQKRLDFEPNVFCTKLNKKSYFYASIGDNYL